MKRKLSAVLILTVISATAFWARAEPVQNPKPQGDRTMEEREAIERGHLQETALVQQAADQTSSVEAPATPSDLQPAVSKQVASDLRSLPILAPTKGNQTVAPASDGEGTVRAPILDAASRQISFQAVLTDNLGNALVGPVNLRFQIYTSPGGVAVGAAIDVLAVPLNNGIADTQVPVPASSFDGVGREMGVRVNLGAELTPRIKLTAVPYAYRVDRVASEELDDAITLGRGLAPLASGDLSVQNGLMAQPSINLNGAGHQISTYGSDGLEQIRLWGPSYGEILLNDTTGNDTTVVLSATGNSGGQLSLNEPTGNLRTFLSAASTGGALSLRNGSTLQSLTLDGSLGRANATGGYYAVASIGGNVWAQLTSGIGGNLRTNSATGVQTSLLGTSATAGGFLQLNQADGDLGMNVDGDAGTNAGGTLSVYQADGGLGVTVDGDQTNADGGGSLTIYQADGGIGVFAQGDNGGAGLLNVRNNAGSNRVTLDGESTGTGGEISVFDATGNETVEILAAEDSITGGQISLRRADGTTTITMDAEFGTTGDDGRIDVTGRIATSTLQITGGADLSENFDVHSANLSAEPGMVVCIDPVNPGKLVVSGKPYDQAVAGVISGAGGIRTGMLMAQKGTEKAEGKQPVALTGRVYVLADASYGAIAPGSLLTTSATPGHAMKVADHSRAQGAIIGKAMTSLNEGKGLVLVLVTLQ